MMNFNWKAILADQRKRQKYVCDRISPAGMQIVLYQGSLGESSIFADLSVEHREGNTCLVIQSNEPDVADLNAVYQHFQRLEMTHEDLWKELVFVDPVREFRRKIEMLSQKERELFFGTSETERLSALAIAQRSGPGHELDGQTKGCLRLLVKMGLLESSRDGYIRRRPPKRPYSAP